MHSFSSLLHTELCVTQSSVRMPPVQEQQLCTVHTTLFLFHRTALCKLCCLYSFAHCQTADLQFCVLVSAPARGNNPWAPNFVCTDFLEQFSIYSRFADSCFKPKGPFFLQRLMTKDAKVNVKLMSCLAREWVPGLLTPRHLQEPYF